MAYRVGEFVKVINERHATTTARLEFRKKNSLNIPLIGIIEYIDHMIYTLRMPHGYGFSCAEGNDLNNFLDKMLEPIDQDLASKIFELSVKSAY